jgi:hypothetical protein
VDLVAYKDKNSHALIDQLPMQRSWMEDTFDRHAYQCFPVSMANRLGYGIAFDVDISFIWDGTYSSEDKHVRVLRGGDFVSSRRANGTVSFDTGIYFSPYKNISLLTMPPPNIFSDGYQCMSTIVSSTALVGSLPIALMINKPNEEILIKAGTIVASVMPVFLNKINDMTLTVKNGLPDFMRDEEWNNLIRERGDVSQQLNSKGEWTHFYRNAIDHRGDKYGEHEVKKIVMKVVNED